MQTNVTKPYAEHHGSFIEKTLKNLFGDTFVLAFEKAKPEEQGSSDALHDHGLYMFFVKPDNYFCPIYVGSTTSSFYGRFYNHANGGVIDNFFNIPLKYQVGFQPYACRDNPEYALHAIQLPCSATKAVLLEMFFLKMFDFALNTDHNDSLRDTLVLGGPQKLSQDSIPTFKKVFEDMQSELMEIIQGVDGALKM